MNHFNVQVRDAVDSDVAALTEIHNCYVRESCITLDEELQSMEERGEWMSRYASTGRYRLLVAESAGAVLGCAFSSEYRPHPAFRETVETSIYLHPSARGQHAGTILYAKLFDVLKQERIHRILVGIALPNPASVALHEKFGFRAVGVFDGYAIKNGKRVSSIWMEKAMDGAW